MGKDKNPRRVADNEAMAKLRMLRTSPAEAEPRCGPDPRQEGRKGAERSDLLEEADRG
jgi:hypothetical protein